ncbi:laccase [Ranunculus cassubicifolius]
MASSISLLSFFLLLFSSIASAATVEHTFNVGERTFRRVCGRQVKTVVNGSLPGPTVKVREGDTLIVHVLNNSPYNITIHWHGVFQLFSAWADGPAYVNQCPILPKTSYTYRFNVTEQEGTLWWHAHISRLRETVYGALIIRPRLGRSYPFPKPYKEIPILFGEWYNTDIVELEKNFIREGGIDTLSNALTINGQPGDQFPCSRDKILNFNVIQGKTYLLRIINAVMNDHLFFKVAGHTFTVVAVDARYTEPYKTDIIVIAPGQTVDALVTANQPAGNYYMASHVYSPTPFLDFINGTTTTVLHYEGASTSSTPLMPILPGFRDTETAFKFYSNLTSLTTNSNPHWLPVPTKVDENMFIAFGLGFERCGHNNTCTNPVGSQYRFSANMNSVSFQTPTRISLLEAYHRGVKGIFTDDFPSNPPMVFDYTNPSLSLVFPHPTINEALLPLVITDKKETRVKRLKYNSVVEIVLQNKAVVASESHPMHFHGFDFYILAQGFGNYDASKDSKKFNTANPQLRNTIAVPRGGWAVIRFRANNPGMWYVHCHRETHVPWGMNMAFLIENGPTPSTSLPPPPADLPRC